MPQKIDSNIKKKQNKTDKQPKTKEFKHFPLYEKRFCYKRKKTKD